MYRVEIIANYSVQDDIINALEDSIENFYYSIIPTVHGRGRRKRKLGTVSWPEENFILFSYIEKNNFKIIKQEITKLKNKFQTEGIKLFVIPEIKL